jgi:nitrite reductase/ring-hydroxylating ferredoxin subunit/uncharacterized membrane protein
VGGVEPAPLERLVTRIEDAESLDGTAALGASALRKVLPQQGRLTDLLSGTPFTHPAHPALVLVPIGAWVSATVLDLTGGDARAARRLVAVGNLSAVPAAVTGANDWLTTQGAERRVGLVHAGLNYTALTLQLLSSRARRRGHRVRGALLSLTATSVVAASGWLGGHLAYALGVGVDTTVFEQFPTDWTDLAAEDEIPVTGGIMREAAGIPVLLARVDGAVTAIADRCTHRGGPLHEGRIADGCVTCPWHGSTFRLADGSIVTGPASRPEPALEVRVAGGRVAVRRADEPRTLRTNPVGP